MQYAKNFRTESRAKLLKAVEGPAAAAGLPNLSNGLCGSTISVGAVLARPDGVEYACTT